MRRFQHLTRQVESILRDTPNTRNSDIDLTLWVWYSFYKEHLEWDVNEALPDKGRWIVPLGNVRALPSEDRISRTRRKFQEPTPIYPNGQYPPTDPEVIAARRRNEENIRTNINSPHWSDALET